MHRVRVGVQRMRGAMSRVKDVNRAKGVTNVVLDRLTAASNDQARAARRSRARRKHATRNLRRLLRAKARVAVPRRKIAPKAGAGDVDVAADADLLGAKAR